MRRDDKLDWDLASIVASEGALLFALDLDYEADTEKKVFTFGPPRKARFEFDLPSYFKGVKDVFRIDADGITEVAYESTDKGVRIEDQVSRVAIYVAAVAADLRKQLAARRRELLQYEKSFQFDPAHNDADFKLLESFPGKD